MSKAAAAKQDLNTIRSDLEARLSGVEANLQGQITSLRSDMKYEMAAPRVDIRNDMKVMFDDVLNVLGDILTHIDKRFNKIEVIIDKHGKAIKRLENSRY